MIFYNQHIINPENFRQPSFYISPFNTSDLEKNAAISLKSDFNPEVVTKYKELFGKHQYFISGKSAVYFALKHYQLKENDEVLILTTTSNVYVSSCVTNEIKKFCNWSRVRSAQTKLVFIIHEFGKIYEDLEFAKSLNLPIIEDCAMSLFSESQTQKVGRNGDFTIFSLAKFFPVQFGGVLRSNIENFRFEEVQNDFSFFLKNITLHYLESSKLNKSKRISNNFYLLSKLNSFGLKPYFNYTENETPSVCMFRNNGLDLPKLKIFMQSNGVECSVFYGEDAFFIPVHQALNKFEMDFLINLIQFFINETK